MDAVFLKIVNMSIAASWVVLAVLVLRFVLKKAPKWISVALWALVAVRLVCPFSFESMLSLIPSTETVPEEIIYAAEPKLDSGVQVIDEIVNPVVTGSLAPSKELTSVNPVQVWLFIGRILWIVGMCAMVLYAALSYARLRKKVGASIHLTENIYLCDYIDTPFILGVCKPRIYLPSNMDPDSAAHVLSHERAHLARRDHWWKPLGFGLLTLHWFNPIMWLAYILLCRDIEMACDERVVKELAAPEKKAYSEALLRCSVSRRMIAACPLAFGEVGVKERVKTVMNYKKPAFWVVLIAVIALLVAAVCLLTDPVGQKDNQSFPMSGSNVSNIDTEDVLKQIRKFNGMEENENAYMNTHDFEILLDENFDFAATSVQYFFYREQKTYSSILIFAPYADSFTLLGTEEWEEQKSSYLLHHYLEALRCIPQERIRTMTPEAERYQIRHVEEGTPGSYDRVIRYSDQGVGPTDGWLIHLEVTPMYRGEDGEFAKNSSESIHLFYGDGIPNVNGVIMDAKVLEISGNSVLVEPLPGSAELNSADKIWVNMLTDWAPMPKVGEILRIAYDGLIMETYPAQLGEVFLIQRVSWEYASEQANWEEIVHFNEQAILNIQIPEGWEYERVNTASDGSILAIRFHPAGEEGWVTLQYESGLFGVCGTGLVTENVTVAGYEATQGFYDGKNIWSYISLHEDLPGSYVILNDGADEWLHNANHHARVWEMLETIQITSLDVPEYVSYQYAYINMGIEIPNGWEYEISEYKEGIYRCGIRFRPEGEEGWINLQWAASFSVPKTDRTVEPRPLGNTEVEVGSYLGEPFWRYMYFQAAPGHYTLWNVGADSWLGNSEYQQDFEEILNSIRVADGVLWKDELLSKIKFKLLWYDYDDLYADMNQITGVWSVGLRRDDGTWTYLNFDQESNLLSSEEGTEAAAMEIMDAPIEYAQGRVYKYEKEGLGGDFTITLRDDGTYEYYEGVLSSYCGMGTWKKEGDILILKDDHYFENRFRLDGDDLIFIAEGSTNFMYLDVADGDRFDGQQG